MDNRLPEALLPWFGEHKRDLPWRQDREPYHVWLSEIMLQQTRVEAVKGYYSRFLSALPTIAELATVDSDSLYKLWEGLGYYSRVRNIQKAAVQIMEYHQGVFPREYQSIRDLAGIGDYTAGAISSICFEQPTPAVDGNVLRVMARLEGDFDDITLAKTKKKVAENLEKIYPTGHCGDFTQSLMELGATVCVPNGAPKCECCPCRDFCVCFGENLQEKLPVKAPKKPRRVERRTVFLLFCDDAVAVEKRPAKGLLAGLWQFPNVEGALAVQEAMEQVAQWGAKPSNLMKYEEKVHIFTHIQWEMGCYTVECQGKCPQFQWVTRGEIANDVALPTAFRQFWNP
ncbi:MAG: A/G-specific adenine glycosylase [Eubacteriales bacterium]